MDRERFEFVGFEPKYLDEIAEAEKICFENDPWSRESFVEAAESEGFCIILVKDMQMSKIIAYSIIYYAADQADLANIAVLPECRGQKIGKALLEKTMEIARDNGVSDVFLEVRESNFAARGLYQSSDFVEIGRRRKYYKNPREDAIIMVRKL